MTTQAQLDTIIANAKKALFAINPAFVPDMQAETYQQSDCTGFTPSGDIHTCAICP